MLLATVVSALLVAYNTVTNRAETRQEVYLARNLTAAVVLLVLARFAGVSWDALGLAPEQLHDGWRYGRLGMLVVLVAVAAAAAIPCIRAWFDDRRADLDGGDLAFHTLVRIPIGTALFEELAFRGVLLALFDRDGTTLAAVAGSSVVFGLWHIGPTMLGRQLNHRPVTWRAVAAAVVITALAGSAFAWLRLRSGSLLAPVLVHWAANAAGLLVAAVVRRTRSQ